MATALVSLRFAMLTVHSPLSDTADCAALGFRLVTSLTDQPKLASFCYQTLVTDALTISPLCVESCSFSTPAAMGVPDLVRAKNIDFRAECPQPLMLPALHSKMPALPFVTAEEAFWPRLA